MDKGGSITNRELSRLLYSLGEVITLEEVNGGFSRFYELW